jgi:hypothetical protein
MPSWTLAQSPAPLVHNALWLSAVLMLIPLAR